MTRWLRALLACALLVGLAGTAEAVTRGGTLIYARYADSLFLDPVLNDANVDIWILTNLYDTLLQPTADGNGRGARPRHRIPDVRRRAVADAEAAARHQVLGRLADHRE